MGFIDSYKHLEKLCGEILNDEKKVTAYIDEMINTPRGSYVVRGWDQDLKNLKHYRWIRNQIVHEPGCSEENMCKPADVLWLDNFYLRIMNQNDPLALYRKAIAHYSDQKPKSIGTDSPEVYVMHQKKTINNSQKTAGCLIFAVSGVSITIVIVISLLLLFQFL